MHLSIGVCASFILLALGMAVPSTVATTDGLEIPAGSMLVNANGPTFSEYGRGGILCGWSGATVFTALASVADPGTISASKTSTFTLTVRGWDGDPVTGALSGTSSSDTVEHTYTPAGAYSWSSGMELLFTVTEDMDYLSVEMLVEQQTGLTQVSDTKAFDILLDCGEESPGGPFVLGCNATAAATAPPATSTKSYGSYSYSHVMVSEETCVVAGVLLDTLLCMTTKAMPLEKLGTGVGPTELRGAADWRIGAIVEAAECGPVFPTPAIPLWEDVGSMNAPWDIEPEVVKDCVATGGGGPSDWEFEYTVTAFVFDTTYNGVLAVPGTAAILGTSSVTFDVPEASQSWSGTGRRENRVECDLLLAADLALAEAQAKLWINERLEETQNLPTAGDVGIIPYIGGGHVWELHGSGLGSVAFEDTDVVEVMPDAWTWHSLWTTVSGPGVDPALGLVVEGDGKAFAVSP